MLFACAVHYLLSAMSNQAPAAGSSIDSTLLEAPAAHQMAIDAALIEQARQQSTIFVRCYRMHPPAVTIGRHQKWARVIDEGRCNDHGWEWARRPTGGGALLHKSEINYAVAAVRGQLAPVGAGEFRAVFCRIAESLAEVMRDFGINPDVNLGEHPLAGRQHGLCGRSLSGYEISAHGRKLVAAAQLVTPHGVLQHGTIYLQAPTATDSFWPPAEGGESQEVDQRWADLGESVRSQSWRSLASGIEMALAHCLSAVKVSAILPEIQAQASVILAGWQIRDFQRSR